MRITSIRMCRRAATPFVYFMGFSANPQAMPTGLHFIVTDNSAPLTLAAACLPGEHPGPFDHHAPRDGCAFRSGTLFLFRSISTFFCAIVYFCISFFAALYAA